MDAMNAGPVIRPALPDDAAQIAPLIAELGYSASMDAVRARIADVRASAQGAIYVAVDRESNIVGWIHIARRASLEAGCCAEIVGLVVGQRARRTGAGKALLAEAERWATLQALDEIVVRSNIVRTESHPFYAAAGYDRAKTQHVYRKAFAAGGTPQEP